MPYNFDQHFSALNDNYQIDARKSFAAQGVMQFMGANMRTLQPGYCVIELPYSEDLTQQDGFFHAGVTSTIADSAGGYAALSLMPPRSRVLTVEFKINLTSKAEGSLLRAEATVIKPGRTLTVADIAVFVLTEHKNILCAIVQQTTMCIPEK